MIDILLQKLGEALIGLLNEDVIYITLGTMVATQIVKLAVSYLWRVPPTIVIWFIISPVVAAPIAAVTWSYHDRIPWLVAALVASMLANILFAVFLKQVLGRFAPDVYEQINHPINRRKAERGPFPGESERRKHEAP